MPSGYNLSSYGDMVSCEPRMSAFDKALRDAITPGCTVIDLGAGPGMFSILACRYGAGKVIAIEPDPSIELLRQVASDNGYSDRIEIVQGPGSDYHPATKADVIVSDLRGGLPLFEGHVAAIKDARERLLAPGGTLIPARDHIHIAPVEAVDTYRRYEEPWRSNRYDVDLSAGSRFVLNQMRRVDLKQDNLIGPAQNLATLDYATIVDPNLHARNELRIARTGLVHGLLLWFDAELGPGAAYSNAPGAPPQVYSQTFLPLEKPLTVDSGDCIEAEVKANLVGGSYVWSWNTRRLRATGGSKEPAVCQSTFLGNIFQREQLTARSARSVPPASEAAAIAASCLSLIDGERDLQAIADEVAERFPSAFDSPADALDRVAQIIGRQGMAS